MENFLIVKDQVKNIRKFGVQGRTLEFKIKSVPEGSDPVKWTKMAIEQIVMKGTENIEPHDQVGFTFCSKDFSRGQGWMRFKPAVDVTVDDVFNKISSIYQSNSAGLNTETFCLGITIVKMPKGRGRARKFNTFDEECTKRRSIMVIKNKDNLCLPRALIVAKAYVDKNPKLSNIRQDVGRTQEIEAIKLTKDAGVGIPIDGAGIPELQQFQSYLTNYKIVVYSYGSKGRDVVFEGFGDGPKLNLLFHEGHYNVITSLTGAFLCAYYCEECHKPSNNKNEHRCGGTCFACRRSPACSKDTLKIPCSECGRSFYGEACFNAHLGSVCEKIKRCRDCFKIYTKNHVCGEIFCKTCGKNCPSDHLCYMQVDSGTPLPKDFLFIFYDLEATQETVMPDSSLLQEPNLCVFKQVCYMCIESDANMCIKCGVRLQVLKNNPIERFMEFLLNQRKLFKKIVVLAHYGGGYDHQFALNYILTKTDLTPDLIMRGTKLVSMNVENVRFLDSLNYFPMALSALPKAFGLTQLKKGYFPHLFNKVENQNYVGVIPPLQYYDPDNLKEDAREKLISWHAERVNEGYVFDFRKEIVEYCISDVEILAQASLSFRKQLLDTSNVCPFLEATTIASTCNKVYRRNFLQPDTIGLIPKGGYRFKDHHSKVALQWLLWEEKQRGIKIQHAARGSEALIGNFKVDGLQDKTIFEFQGCYYHGCPICYPETRTSPLHDDPSDCMENRYDKTNTKNQYLQSQGYEVVEMWECTFRKMITPEIKLYTENHYLMMTLPLNPRDALYGGRTGNTVEYFTCSKDEKIKYVDVCSLYPWVCKYGKFPIGHPKKIYVGEECNAVDITELSGLIKCKVLPPTNLYHPVLPVKMNSKCMFVLCRKCGEDFMEEECEHSNDERALTGTWVIEELVKALSKGYKIIETYEIWSYDTLQLSKSQKGLFSDMMNRFIKLKQQASGWPSGCESDEQKNNYIEEFFERENVKLDFSEISENPGLRSLAKLMLNSFWGKLAQRENLPKTSIVKRPNEFYAMLVNPSIYVNTLVHVNEETIVVTWEYVEEAASMSPTVNVVLASYVTALARLKLYSYLDLVGDRAFYYDTDSIVYMTKPGLKDLPTGQCIGDLTDELGGGSISEFVSGGPKNYAYKYILPDGQQKICCKVKGISLNYAVSKTINFDTIKEMVLEKADPVSIVTKQIQRTQDHCVITKTVEKIYRPNSTKRKFSEDFTSVPYGYKKLKT